MFKTSSNLAHLPMKRGSGYPALVKAIASLNTQLVAQVASVANQGLVLRNWMIGAWINQYQKRGADRAKYGERLFAQLASDLGAKGIKGCGERMLQQMAVFAKTYPEIGMAIPQSLIAESGQPVLDLNSAISDCGIQEPASAERPTPLEREQLARISWTKFLELIRLDDPWQRAFYENECLRSHWSVSQLQRQIGSLLYERTGLSTNKKAVVERARKQEPQETIADVLRDPYILEFTGLADLPEYSEKEMETALLDHLQRFLLELGQGFCFEARQFRMTEGRRHHRVDLVFYHRILRCHVLIDLKIRAFQPEDAGQMNFYVNWFKANKAEQGDNPPVGILLCSGKDSAEVEFATAGMDNKLFVSRYLKKLPSVEQLKAFLERDRAEIKSLTRTKMKQRQ